VPMEKVFASSDSDDMAKACPTSSPPPAALQIGGMQPLRILIVDDSAVIRRLLGDLMASEPGIVVAGTAANGGHALARIPEVKLGLITLDTEMPGMDGLETLVQNYR
jgi:PleD family two-component response regulator